MTLEVQKCNELSSYTDYMRKKKKIKLIYCCINYPTPVCGNGLSTTRSTAGVARAGIFLNVDSPSSSAAEHGLIGQRRKKGVELCGGKSASPNINLLTNINLREV